MPLTVQLEFSDEELEYFCAMMQRARVLASERTPHEIATAARDEVDRMRSVARSPFITRRLARMDRLIAMLEDPEWQLPDTGRRRVLDALAYVAEADDLVPDNVPALGLVDDAIMLELVLRELQHELEGYEDFDEFRREEAARRARVGKHTAVSHGDWLDLQRQALHERIRERRERDLARGAGFQLITHF